MHFCGDDHLDSDRVVLKAKTEKKQKKAAANQARGPEKSKDERSRVNGKAKAKRQHDNGKTSKARRRHAERQQDKLMARIEAAETRMREIDAASCTPGFYDNTPADEVKGLQMERSELERDIETLTAEWELSEAAVTG